MIKIIVGVLIILLIGAGAYFGYKVFENNKLKNQIDTINSNLDDQLRGEYSSRMIDDLIDKNPQESILFVPLVYEQFLKSEADNNLSLYRIVLYSVDGSAIPDQVSVQVECDPYTNLFYPDYLDLRDGGRHQSDITFQRSLKDISKDLARCNITLGNISKQFILNGTRVISS